MTKINHKLSSKKPQPTGSYTLRINRNLLNRVNLIKTEAKIRGDKLNINQTLISNLYDIVDQLEKEYLKNKITLCEKCKSEMVIKTGPKGDFYACPAFPECRYTKSLKI